MNTILQPWQFMLIILVGWIIDCTGDAVLADLCWSLAAINKNGT